MLLLTKFKKRRNIAATSINAVTSTIASVLLYMPLRSALIRSNLFIKK